MYHYWQPNHFPYDPHYEGKEVYEYEHVPIRDHQNRINLSNGMRTLWAQHVVWTRMAIISILLNLPDTKFVLARLLRNAQDMGNALESLYGDRVARKFSELIKDHLVIAADLVRAAKAGDKLDVAIAERKWYANADDIIKFLTKALPYLPKKEFQKMFYRHLSLTKAEAESILNKDYQGGIQLYDQIEHEALMMADQMTKAIEKQFPERF
ncbi:truncated hemoglobin YjbI [Croceifilum oryzae]|uniref:Truncated hemoglobin YjbI n=1 Tax=Croceifilum oryzae TaxID=1553429 RepID=A0AAJ1TGM9_9BACL|nr:acetylglutamate kinase [Croceifilum oryzae]MDQ0418154.1 truncated hemoglobin YjbI [Croceifilum oryzae]